MAGEGRNKVAKSLLDLQPTAILEFFIFVPDAINDPTTDFAFHGGTIYDKALTWQGRKYEPIAVETDGFDLLADGQLARPKIKVTNHNNVVTNLLQNHKDFINGKLIRKRASVKFLDDVNFDGGNPFGVADPTAELTSQVWIVGRKTQESKLFVEFELNSPLDLENFTVNSRGVVAKFCYWQYRGEGCRYEGFPIEKEDGSLFQNVDGDAIVPSVRSSYTSPLSPVNFYNDPDAEWSSTRSYVIGDIVYVISPTIAVADQYGSNPKNLKTVYVCASGNSGQSPEGNPSFWQKDGCTKKFAACQKRFNESNEISFIRGQNILSGFSGVKFSGAASSDGYVGPINSGLFHTTEPKITGAMTGDFTIIGWANMTQNSPLGAGLFSTTKRDGDSWPASRYINILGGTSDPNDREINLYFQGTKMHRTQQGVRFVNANGTIGGYVNTYNTDRIATMQGAAGINNQWNRYVISHTTGTDQVRDEVEATPSVPADQAARTKSSSLSLKVNLNGSDLINVVSHDLENGNFARLDKTDNRPLNAGRTLLARSQPAGFTDTRALPETFRLGAVEQYFGISGYETGANGYISTMNGCIGPWAIWSRTLSDTEIDYLYKRIRTPNQVLVSNNFDKAPRNYYECTGQYSAITGDRLVAWWAGSTGDSSINTGLLDIHGLATGSAGFGLHLTGSGQFSGFSESYKEAPTTLVKNFTPRYPRFGGFPGTDGFSYGRDTNIY